MRIAIIPARGGSKRIPHKNIRPFAGKPIIAYSIEAARRSGLFERVIVSTDDEAIAQVATQFGAEAPFRRPAELSDDFTGTHDVVAHAVRWLGEQGPSLHEVCCLYPTAPFVRVSDIHAGYALLGTGEYDSVIAATTFPYPIFRAVIRPPEGGLAMVFPQHFPTRSQDLPEALHDAGQFYWAHASAWLAPSAGFTARTGAVVLPRWRVQDIDTEEDWRRAELMARLPEMSE